MLQEVEEITPTIRKLKVDIPSSVIEAEIARAYNELRVTATIPGFRAGKAPLALLEKKFGKEIEDKVLGKVVPEFYVKAVEEAHISPVTYPDIEGHLKITKNKPLSFTATVEIKPEVKNLNYEGITVNRKDFSVEDEEIQTALKTLQENKAILKVSEELPLKEGDMAIIDCDAFIDEKEIKELSSKEYPFIVGSQGLPKEFSDALSGKKKGENIEITINFETTHPNKTIAGKKVFFTVLIKEIKEKVLPALDDEFAKGFQCSNVEELKKKIYEKIYNGKKKQTENEYKKQLIDHLISSHTFEVPSSMVKKELEFLISEAKQNAASKGEPIRSDEELSKELERKAYRNVNGMVILDAIGKKEKIETGEEDVKKAIDEIAAENEIKPEDVKKLFIMKDGSLDGFKNRLYTDKVLDFVLSKAVIQ
ncbi:MAG: trigger factor [Thermodesulfovibrionia bacterium]|nr:trigger factor [Thermodesulfovibrionia bacterium]